jgi:hypothetical protein
VHIVCVGGLHCHLSEGERAHIPSGFATQTSTIVMNNSESLYMLSISISVFSLLFYQSSPADVQLCAQNCVFVRLAGSV